MNKIFYVTIIFALTLISCSVTEKSVVGTYESNYQETLKLNSDKTFSIEYVVSDTVTTVFGGTTTVTGHWTLNNKTISLSVDNKFFKSWECWGLKVKGKTLKRPAHCGPTHRFIIFKRTTQQQ